MPGILTHIRTVTRLQGGVCVVAVIFTNGTVVHGRTGGKRLGEKFRYNYSLN